MAAAAAAAEACHDLEAAAAAPIGFSWQLASMVRQRDILGCRSAREPGGLTGARGIAPHRRGGPGDQVGGPPRDGAAQHGVRGGGLGAPPPARQGGAPSHTQHTHTRTIPRKRGVTDAPMNIPCRQAFGLCPGSRCVQSRSCSIHVRFSRLPTFGRRTAARPPPRCVRRKVTARAASGIECERGCWPQACSRRRVTYR